MAQELLKVRCPHCRFRFKVDAKYSGRAARCPRAECGGRFRIPQRTMPETAGNPSDTDFGGRTTTSDLFSGTALQSKSGISQPEKRRHSETVQGTPAEKATRSTAGPNDRRETRRTKTNVSRAASRAPLWKVGLGVAGVLVAALGLMLAPNGSSSSNNVAIAGADSEPRPEPAPDVFGEKLQPFLKQYCQDCHNDESPEAGINFATFKSEDSIVKGNGRKAWEKTLGMLEIGAMPPSDSDQPPAELRDELAAWLEQKLFNLDCEMIDDPGRVTVRRLNRVEYRNTIRDLLGVDFDPSNDFPTDDVGYGFDNIGDVLSLSPLLMEKYLNAAETITAEAIPVVSPNKLVSRFNADRLPVKPNYSMSGDFRVLASQGEIWLDYEAPIAGEYEINIRAKATQLGGEPARMELKVDNKSIRVFDVTGEKQEREYVHKVRLAAGKRRVSAAFINDHYIQGKGDRNLYVGRFQITRPEDRSKLDQFITQQPRSGSDVRSAAAAILRPFIDRAFRRPATDEDVQRYVSIVEMATADGESFEQGIQFAVQGVLVSPGFLFRVEADSQPDDPMAERILTDYELASRLSYFLWSSMPDAELFRAASAGELRQHDGWRKQTLRMLADSRSRAIVDNFAEQWLNLRLLDGVIPDPNVFPTFDEVLCQDMKQETLLLFETIMRDDRSVLEFLDADFTFMNERLAKHYGVDGVEGAKFQQVSLNPQQRAGILTHASILMLTSNPDRTSPVKRGKWILENILGEAAPPAPPGVPELEETQKGNPNASLRQQLELHRADPGCASCHRTLDTLGFGFENFDAVGKWRDKDGGQDVDASGELPSGEKFNGPVELIQLLKGRKRQFARSLTEKLLTYALGRGLQYYDRCAVDEILMQLNRNEYRFSELVLGIVASKPFQKRRGDGIRE